MQEVFSSYSTKLNFLSADGTTKFLQSRFYFKNSVARLTAYTGVSPYRGEVEGAKEGSAQEREWQTLRSPPQKELI